jgi:hypothetical protein
MIRILLTGFLIVALNVIIQASASILLIRRTHSYLKKWESGLTNQRMLIALIVSFFYLTFAHIIHALIWAISIEIIPQTRVDFGNFSEIVYYSIVTFTTLGYGDLTIHSSWRILSGIEAINGIMLIGWSTALMYSLIQRLFNARIYVSK